MKFKWPLVFRTTMDSTVASELDRVGKIERERRASMQRDWDNKWAPLLKDAVRLSASKDFAHGGGEYSLHVKLHQGMMDFASSYESQQVWDYISDYVAHEVRRQMATLNFSWLAKNADLYTSRGPGRRHSLEYR